MVSSGAGRLVGKIALSTGGASVSGWATAERFAQEGATVIVADSHGTRRPAGGDRRCVVFLASDESTFMTGSEVVIDGGFTAQ